MDLLYCILIAVCSLGVKANVNTYVRTFEQPEERISTLKTVCYYPMSNAINTTTKDPIPEGFNSTLCSHVIFIPTIIDRNNQIQPATPSHAVLFQRAIPVIRQQNPELIIMVSNGGHFDPVMESMKNISQFVQSAVVLLRKYNFDGLDLDWEFPGWPITEKPKGQIHNFSIVLTELRKSFEMEAVQTNRTRLLLSAAVAATKEMAEKIYEMDYLKKALDFVNMMGYDYNGWGLLSPLTAYNSPLFPEAYDKYAFNTNNLAWSATHWGSWIGKDKLMVGIPFYCHAFKLLTPLMHGYHAIATGRGECDMAAYLCACDALKKKNATRVFDNAAKVPYLYYGDQWVSYDDVQSTTIKAKWIKENGFGGLMTWNMKSDDYEGVCDGKTKYPLMNAVLRTIHNQI